MKVPSEFLAVAQQLGEMLDQVVFVGGMVRGLLVTDAAVPGPRPTKDVDVILDVQSRVEFRRDHPETARTRLSRGVVTTATEGEQSHRPSAPR